jgi:hypothetical protein
MELYEYGPEERRLRELEEDIISRLDAGRPVCIDNGCLCGRLSGYSREPLHGYWDNYEGEVTFHTDGGAFGKVFRLAGWSYLREEETDGKLYLHVQ